MTKSQIKQELRRSACEDKEPALCVSDDAYAATYNFREDFEQFEDNKSLRTFFLLVAEAL